jgi:glutamate racemase
MINNKKPIGVFDSGLGGLTVVRQLVKLLPHENIVYLGDTARVPYGTRSKETIIKFSFEDASFLLKKNIKCLVIACNTSSALAGVELKKKLEIPVFDVIAPALKEAKENSKFGKIGVIGTRGTIGSGAYSVPFPKVCPLFVPFIEEGEIEGDAIEIVAKNYLSDFKKDNIDTLILGCTHYPIIKDIIEKEIDSNVNLVDPGISVAKELWAYLTENKMLNNQSKNGQRNYFVTDYSDRFVKVAEMFLGEKIKDKLIKVELKSE